MNASSSTPEQSPGHTDTPTLPGSNWRVHDANRPQPRIVTPAPPESPFAPPSDAVTLFDGTDLAHWETLEGEPAGWKVENGYMEVVPQSGNIRTRRPIGDCQLHLEWAAPEVIEGPSQKRGNSGVFLMERYEIQVLDNYDNPTYADGYVGAIYGQYPPLVNAARPPGQWQTFDIIWAGPRFDGDTLVRPAHVTVIFNGVLLHHAQPLNGPTRHKTVGDYEPHPPEGPLMLQDHKNPVRFRNIWYRPLTDDAAPSGR